MPRDSAGDDDDLGDDGEDVEFDVYAAGEAELARKHAELEERAFRLEVQARLGENVDEDVMTAALAALIRRGEARTPAAVAKEYGLMGHKFTKVQEPHRTAGTGGASLPPGRSASSPVKHPTLVETIKKSQKDRGLYAY